MNKTYYVCKYTPVELLEALGGECEILNDMPEGFDLEERHIRMTLDIRIFKAVKITELYGMIDDSL